MQTLYGFSVRERLYASGNKTVLRVVRERDGLQGVLKFFDTDAKSHVEIERIKNEFNCLKAVRSPNVIWVHDLVFFERGVGILMDDFGGESLATVLRRRRKFEVRAFLEVAIKLTRGLRDIHRERVIHRDMKPSNVLLDENSGDLRIIDFGISNAFSVSQAGEQIGSLPYMSPEQTGKMNRTVDLRSDLYSLGVLFYELVTGRCPFVSEDPLELVHAHIAKTPESPSELDASIPSVLSAVILKLLKKEAESRYQSAAGVLADLEDCFSYVERRKEIPSNLTIGTRDKQQIFRIPEKLYGRQVELQRLLNTFSKAAEGAFEPVLVSGYSGIGKSALINEIQKPLVAKRGFFAAGKYDQFNKAKPYSAIQQALGELVRIVLRQSEDEIGVWRANILTALSGEGQCLVDVVPMLETLIGVQPELPDAGPVSRQNRFNRNCNALLGVFATAKHPLVLFLDDVQWADSASLELVRSWIDKSIDHMMLILAYRDNEVGPHHSLTLMLQESLGERVQKCRIQLSSIGEAHVEELVADTLQGGTDDVRGLASVLMTKTGGNPFFLVQMFRGLYEDGSISFGTDRWTWELAKITARDLTYNVVELMTQKLQRYPEGTGSALNMCAILGSEFALHTLASVLETSDESAYRALLPAIEDGLLIEADGRLKFVHDKVHEASYGLVEDAERKQRHRLVGRHLVKTLDDAAIENQLFKIVEDLNRARDLIRDQVERNELVRLNVRAGQRALASSAFSPSMELFEIASSLLPAEAWRSDTQLAFDAYFGLASANYACARYDRCEKNLVTCLENVDDPIRNAPAVQLLLRALFSQNRHSESVAVGLQRLDALGLKLPARPTKVHVVAAYAMFKLRQGFRSTASLVDLPAATDQRAIASIGILNALMPSAYLVSSELYGLFATQMARLSLRFGSTVFTPFAYAACMVTQAGAFKAIRSGEAYLKLAFALQERLPNAQIRGQVLLIQSGLSHHQTRSLRDWEPEVNAALTCNLDVGALQFADYSLAFTRTHSIFFGTKSLDGVYKDNVGVLALHRKHGDQEVIANQEFILHTLCRWRDAKSSPGDEIDPVVESFDVEGYAQKLAKPGNGTPRGYLAVLRQAQHYLDGDYEGSLRVGVKFIVQALDLLGVMTEHLHRFLFMLAYLAADHRKLGWGERLLAAGYYQMNRAMLAIADSNAPNFRSHLALIAAEEHRRAGRTAQALSAYERAITEARDFSSFNHALAYRRLASFHRSQGLEVQALMSARQARDIYQAFGFTSEVLRLQGEYPELASGGHEASSQGSITHSKSMHGKATHGKTTPGSSSTTFTQHLEVESLARGAQAISSQVRLEGLVEALLRQLCQSSAAQRAVLLLQEGEALQVQGEMVVSGQNQGLTVLQNVPFPTKRGSQSLLAETLVQFVARVKRTEVLGHAAHEGDFTQDPYVRERKLKSLLCMPILNQGKFLGVLYLENDLAAHAFTEQHQKVLEVLASQAAISVENARLYRNLEQKVEERTAELRRKTNDLNSMLQNLEQGVFTILKDGTIHREYSRQLESILGTRSIAGRNYVDVVFSDTTLSSDVMSQVNAAVGFSVGSELLWYESNRHLLVRELQRRHPDGTMCTLELNWSPILTDGDVVEKLLVSVKDVTELRYLERQAQQQRRDLEMIGQILALPRNTFLDFVRDTEGMLERSERLLQAKVFDEETVGGLFRNMHTIKGNARTYCFDALAHAAHDAEETYAGLRALSVTTEDILRLETELRSVRGSLRRYQHVYEHNLESFVATSTESTQVDTALVTQIRKALKEARLDVALALVDAIGTSTVEGLVDGLANGVRDMAARLGKPAPELRTMTTGVRFRPEVVSTLRDVFTHLFRNGVDHGIESASERLDCGKSAAGEIVITARPTESGCEILVRDDGRGLAIGKLRRLAARDGIPVENDEQVAELVFRSGVSTAETLTDISGRGVGMDAVRRFIREQGGDVRLEMIGEGNGEYTPFITRITLPRKHTATVSYAANSNGVESVIPYRSVRPSRPSDSRMTVG